MEYFYLWGFAQNRSMYTPTMLHSIDSEQVMDEQE